MEFLRDAFATPTDHGCTRPAQFSLGTGAETAAAAAAQTRLARDAQGTVASFLARWNALRAEQDAGNGQSSLRLTAMGHGRHAQRRSLT